MKKQQAKRLLKKKALSNQPSLLKTFFHRLSDIVSILPRQLSLSIASGLAGGIYRIYRLSVYKEFIHQTIQVALPEIDAQGLARTHLRLLLCSIIDVLRFQRFKQASHLPPEVSLQGWGHYLAAHKQGRGVILVSAHFGCWELIPAVVALQGFPTTVLVQKPSQDDFDALFRFFRDCAGVKTCNNDSLAGLRPILRALRAGETVGLVVDQHGESERLIGHFFGQTVSLPEGPAFLARRHQSPIIPVLVRWQGDQHIVSFFPALEASDHPDDLDLMQTIYDWLEEQIRAHPENWLWTYNRWDKYTPSATHTSLV